MKPPRPRTKVRRRGDDRERPLSGYAKPHPAGHEPRASGRERDREEHRNVAVVEPAAA
jgi:hypothetical protein